MTNPFRAPSVFNIPLIREVCQQIHAEALLRVTRGREVNTVPRSVPVPQLRELRHRFGPEICLVHPAEIDGLFQGMTFSVYQYIETLYCSRLQRSIPMVMQIMSALARQVAVPPIHEEAIWAVCLHLDKRRELQTQVTTRQIEARWWLGAIASDVALRSDGEGQRLLVGVIDISTPRVLAFRVGTHQSLTELAALALYDALVGARHPHPQGAGGLVWNTPTCLLTPEPLIEVCVPSCTELGARVEQAPTTVPLIEDLRASWRALHTHWHVAEARQAVVFDSLLNRTFGTSPLRAREQANHRFGQLIGYQSDPASLVPALRALLPSHEASISQEGEVFCDGLHYTDPLLSLFPGARVSIRRSEQTEAAAWISLNGEVLCQAMARELARRDGSYRAHR